MLRGIRNRIRPAATCWLAAMWVLLQGELSWGNVLGGLLVGLAITLLLPLPKMPFGALDVSWGQLARFAARWLVELMQASFAVAWLAVRPAAPPRSAIVTVPMRVESEFVLSLAAGLYNLQPGGTVSDIDIANRRWTVHLLNAETDADLEREIAKCARLERDMIDIFERT